ncbi:hypothetical protein [uncultured Microbacterium sp.]|uniref:hypothetical protein n=1 Tax=uncultured Microbacterium sp. TaxID=191216 RepID=UPI0025D32273|nr:hypothetical protein [uncultured Microbacterium sp.]
MITLTAGTLPAQSKTRNTRETFAYRAPGTSPQRQSPQVEEVASDENETSAVETFGEESIRISDTASHPAERVAKRTTVNEYRVSGLATWTGRVVEVDGEVFTAELIPDQHTPGVPMLADFMMSDVDGGREKIVEGDVIYVTVRNVRFAEKALPHKTTSIRLRRLGNWKAEDVDDAVRAAEELRARLDRMMG